MEGLQNYNAASSSFASGAGEINQNLGNFRRHTDAVKSYNSGLVAAADEKLDLDTLKNVGQEFGVRMGKQLLGKYGGKFMAKTGLGDWDKKVGKKFVDGIKGKAQALKNSAKSKMNQGKDGEGEGEDSTAPGESSEMGDMSDAPTSRANAPEPQEDNPDFETSDPIPADEVSIDGPSTYNSRALPGEGEDESADNILGDSGSSRPTANESEFNAEGSGVKDVGQDLGDVGGDVGDMAAQGVGDAVKSAIGDGLEGLGAALDATGIGAPLGAIAGVVGGVLEGGALWEAGKGVADWFEQDILGEKPDVVKTKLPTKPPSLAQIGLVATPIEDTSMDLPSSSASF